MQQTERNGFKNIVLYVKEMCGIDNHVVEALAWNDVLKHEPLDDYSMGMFELVKNTTLFLAVRKAIFIALILPAALFIVEKPFSTLGMVKTGFFFFFSFA